MRFRGLQAVAFLRVATTAYNPLGVLLMRNVVLAIAFAVDDRNIPPNIPSSGCHLLLGLFTLLDFRYQRSIGSAEIWV